MGCDSDARTALRFRKSDGSETSSFHVEVVADAPSRHRGLMYRRELNPNSGMLFVFTDTVDRKMWMKNTYVSLDMVFFDEKQKVIGVLENIPILNEEVRSIGRPSRYVLELPAGTVSREHIGVGDVAVIEGDLPNAS